MVTGSFSVNYKYGDVWTLKPIFDIHAGNKDCDIRELKHYLANVDDRTLIVGGGDLIDSIVVTDKRYRKSIDATEGEAVIDEQIEIIYDILKPHRERILGLGHGNHEDTILIRCATDPVGRLCKMLSTEKHEVIHLGYDALYKIVFSLNGGRGRTVTIRQHHGWGGATRTRGANITRYTRDQEYYEADIYLYGHNHYKQHDQTERLGLSGKRLIAKPKLLVLCGSYQKTLSNGIEPTHAEKNGLPPTSLGGVDIRIKPDRDWVKMQAVIGSLD